MSIAVEQEAKFRLDSTEQGSARIDTLDPRVDVARHFESNTLYDFPDERLSKRDEALRLRRVGEKAWLTWKGPQHGSGRIKQRRELETFLSDADAMEGILEAIGASPCFRYEKYRTCFRVTGGMLTLDETPIGSFIEIEASPERIADLAAQLGFDMNDAIRWSYPRLYQLHRLEHPDASEFMVFADADADAPTGST